MKLILPAAILSLIAMPPSFAADSAETKPAPKAESSATEPLELGAKLPAAQAKNQEGADVKLAELGAKGFLLVYFYPKASTPGCTVQACGLRDGASQLNALSITVLGVSTDSVEDVKKFHTNEKLNFGLLADLDAAVVKALGATRMANGMASRQSFLFKDGTLVWRDLKVDPKSHLENVIAAVKANSGTKAGEKKSQ